MMWRHGARCAGQFARRWSSSCIAPAACKSEWGASTALATFSAVSAATWLAVKHQEASTLRCDEEELEVDHVQSAHVALTALSLSYKKEQREHEATKAELQRVQEKYDIYWPRKIMMLFGAPGAGKGTQGPNITSTLGLPQLSTGDMLRDAVANGTPLGVKVANAMTTGELITDEIVIGIISDRIQDADCGAGFILDGFPRTIQQAEALDALLLESGERVNLVLAFDVPEAVLEERVCGRWMHKGSGRSYHVKFCPPQSMQLDGCGNPVPGTMTDNETGEALYQRADDTKEALKKRMQAYRDVTSPLLDHYRLAGIVKDINGGLPIRHVKRNVMAAMSKQNMDH